MAERLRQKPKTFSRRVTNENIPYIPNGKRKLFDEAVVLNHLLSLRESSPKVVTFKPTVRKSRDKKSRFAEAVSI